MPYFNGRQRGLPTPPDANLYYPFASQVQRKGAFESNDHYGQYTAPNAPSMAYHAPPMHYNMPALAPPGLPMPAQSFGNIAAPILPPIIDRSAGNVSQAQASHRDQQEQPAKEEKAVGGVAAVLDYEMDQMTEYVAEMAQSMYALLSSNICLADIDIPRSVLPATTVSPSFRKFVAGLLTSTRLPSTTILLGLTYLARRMSMLNARGPQKIHENQLWRMLTVGLLLGSKFLDDNTFQNRSWADVSGIAVVELNTLEQDWLSAMNWDLYVDHDKTEDFMAWLASWPSWRDEKNRKRNEVLERLAPINTNVQRQRQTYSPAAKYPGYPQSASHDRQQSAYLTPQYEQSTWLPPVSAVDRSPPSSGPNTPEYYNLPSVGMPVNDWYSYNAYYRSRQQSNNLPYVAPQPAPYQAPYQPTVHQSYPSQHIWGHGHASSCYCPSCQTTRQPAHYFASQGYGQQAVAH